MAFDAGAIMAHLDVDTKLADDKLRAYEDRIKRLEREPHKMKVAAEFSDSDVSRARKMFADLDNQISRDAANRLRSSPQGSVLGALNALFSPHPVTGAPTPQQAGQQGLLGKIISSTGTTPTATQAQAPTVSPQAPGAPQAKAIQQTQQAQAGNNRGFLSGLLAGHAGGGGGGGGFGGFLTGFLSRGGGGAAGVGTGLAGGIGPGILGVGLKASSIIGVGGSLVGALPSAFADVGALGGVGAGLGVAALGAKLLIGSQQNQGALYKPATDFMKQLEGVLKTSAAPLATTLLSIFKTLPAELKEIAPLLKDMFAASGGLLQPFIAGFLTLVKTVLPEFTALIKDATPLVGPLLSGITRLLSGLLSGFDTITKAAGPAVSVFANILGTLGKDLGGMLAIMAPVLKQSSVLFQGLLDIIGALFPTIAHLAAIFASALAPVFISFAGAIKDLLPFFTLLGKVIGAFASAVLGDLASAFSAVAMLLKDISPALTIVAKALEQVFNVLENSGVFATLGDAIEKIVPSLAQLINLMVRQLAPLLPVIIVLISQFSTILVNLMAAGLNTVLRGVTSLLKNMPFLVPVLGAVAAAWLAWNLVVAANPIGLVIVAITALIGAITLLVTHWKEVWGYIKQYAEDAWNFIYNGFGKYLLPLLGPVGLIALGAIELSQHWKTIWGDIQQVVDDFYQWIWTDFGAKISNFLTNTLPGWFKTAVQDIGNFWGQVQNTVETPVKFVINDVLDGLISVFDDITNAVGLGKPIPQVHPFGLAEGGLITVGTTGTADDVLARVSRGETVISAADSAMLAPLFSALGIRGYAQGGVPIGRGGALGGQPGGLQRGTTATGPGGVLGKGIDIARILAALFTGNNTALGNAIKALIPGGVGGAAGELGSILAAIPKTLISDLVKYIINAAGSLFGGGAGGAIVKYAESFIGKVPYVFGGTTPAGWDCSGFVDYVYNHFGYHPPRTSEEQFLWVQRTKSPVPGGLAFFAGADGTAQSPGHVGIVVSPQRIVDAYGTGFGTLITGIYGPPDPSGAIAGFGVPPGGISQATGRGSVAVGTLQQWARQQVIARWHQPSEWSAFDDIVNRESGWNVHATNPSSGAYGIPQALPGSKMASAGADWRTDPYTQLRWMFGYIASRWGDPLRADYNERTQHWYDQGGWFMPGPMNGTNQPEAVLTPGQSDSFVALAQAAAQNQNDASLSDVVHAVERLIAVTSRAPGQTAAVIGDVLNGVARGARQRSGTY